jgi:hypothetical protein
MRNDALGLHYWSKDTPELLLNQLDAHKRLQPGLIKNK